MRSSQKQGFSLIEVMVALVIFSLSISLLANSYLNAVIAKETNKSTQNDSAFLSWAKNQILAIEERDDFENGGDFKLPDESSIEWEAEIEETEVLDLFLAKITITRNKENSDTREQKLQVYLHKPDWSEASARSSLLDEKKEVIERLKNERL